PADEIDLRNSGDRLRLKLAVFNDSDPAFTLGDQHRAIRKKRQAVGINKSLRDRDDADLVILGVEQLRRRIHRPRRRTASLPSAKTRTTTPTGASTALALLGKCRERQNQHGNK